MLVQVGKGFLGFFFPRGAAEGPGIGSVDLFFRIFAGFFCNALGETFGKITHESTVVEVESLNGGGRAAAVGGGLSAVGTVEGPEDGVLLHADAHGVDHAAHILGLEVVLGNPVARVVGVRHEEQKAGSVHFPVECSG